MSAGSAAIPCHRLQVGSAVRLQTDRRPVAGLAADGGDLVGVEADVAQGRVVLACEVGRRDAPGAPLLIGDEGVEPPLPDALVRCRRGRRSGCTGLGQRRLEIRFKYCAVPHHELTSGVECCPTLESVSAPVPRYPRFSSNVALAICAVVVGAVVVTAHDGMITAP